MNERGDRLVRTREVLRRMTLSGHPEVSWSVVIDADLDEPADPDEVAGRLASTFAPDVRLGLPPKPVSVDANRMDAVVGAMADDRYLAGRPLVRVAMSGGATPRLALAAHHGVLDGLGLLALLEALLGREVWSLARGLTAPTPPATRFLRAAATRVREATFRPAARVRGTNERGGRGDHLVTTVLPTGSASTTPIVAATGRALRTLVAPGASADRLVLAVGVSRRTGAERLMEDDSAYLRLSTRSWSDAEVADAMRSASVEPGAPGKAWVSAAAGLARPVVSALAGRMGATALVSSLGRISATGPGGVRALRFYPVAHGRSGVAFGAAGLPGAAEGVVLTARCRRGDFSAAGARRLLEAVAAELTTPEHHGS